MNDAQNTAKPRGRFFPSPMASFFLFGFVAGVGYGLVDGLINLFGSSALPLGMARLGLATVARDLGEGMRWGVILGLLFLFYGFVAGKLTGGIRRGIVAMLYGVIIWLFGLLVVMAGLMRSLGERLPLPYQEEVTAKVFFSRFIGPLLTYSVSMRPVVVLVLATLSWAVPVGLGVVVVRLLGKRVSKQPLAFVPSLALTRKSTIVAAAALVVVIALVLSPAVLGRPNGKPNVLLISIDTLRADGLSCYGNPRHTSPVIDKLAAEGTRYENIFSSAPWTLPGHVTMLTGLEPDVHGTYELDRTIPRTAPLLAEIFQNAGYHTYAATSNFLVSPPYGFGRGFEEFLFLPEGRADQVKGMAEHLLSKAGTPWFTFVHFFDPHLPYTPSEQSKRELGLKGPAYDHVLKNMTHLLYRFIDVYLEFNEQQRTAVRGLYDGDVRDVDRALGQLLRGIDLKNTLIFITADHGEEFGEHGWSGHTLALFDESLRVPLIEHGPGVPRGVVVKQTSDLTQLLPLVLSRVGLTDPYGRNQPQFGQGAYGHTHAFGNHRYSWRVDNWSFLTLNKYKYGQREVEHAPGLYDSYLERDNLLGQNAEQAARMQDGMEHFIGREIKRYGRMKTGTTILDEQRLKRLRELGYVN